MKFEDRDFFIFTAFGDFSRNPRFLRFFEFGANYLSVMSSPAGLIRKIDAKLNPGDRTPTDLGQAVIEGSEYHFITSPGSGVEKVTLGWRHKNEFE